MTQAQRQRLIGGQIIASTTLAVLITGAAVAVVRAQYDRFETNGTTWQQAATNATVSAQIASLGDRVGKIETQLNYVLMGIVGAVITQLVALRTAKRP